jgi:hypothetical protein
VLLFLNLGLIVEKFTIIILMFCLNLGDYLLLVLILGLRIGLNPNLGMNLVLCLSFGYRKFVNRVKIVL